MLIIYKPFNFCCFRSLAYTTLYRLRAVFFYVIFADRTAVMHLSTKFGAK